MKKILLCLLPAIAVVACNGGNNTSPTNTNPVITLLTESNMPTAVTECYHGASSFISDVSAINNNGVMTGTIQANPESGCLQKEYLFGNNGNQLQVIPLLQLPPDSDLQLTGAITSAISSNLITAGITFASKVDDPSPYELATYNNYLMPNIIAGANYLIGVSENGTFIAGYNIGGQPTLFNTILSQEYNLTFNNIPMQNTQITSVSNIGIAAGNILQSTPDSNDSFSSGIICSSTTKSCSYIVGGATTEFDASINAISSNSKWIYGYATHDNSNQIFNVNLETFAVTQLEKGFDDIANPILNNNVVTDTGDIIVKDDDTSKLYLLVPLTPTASENNLYSIDDLAAKLNLPDNVSLTNAYLSPNGNYIAFDVIDYGSSNLFGVKVYFPNGIANYVSQNLTPLTKNKNLSKKASWFKGEHVVN
ncbi:MAG: hypothetical protein PHC75_09800 [Burkholderiales bacterium]|nr:hypothetical protein [Burkholderiales bacterium]